MTPGPDGAAEQPVTIRPARPDDAPELARLMTDSISWGEVRHLGTGFNVLLHRHFISSLHALCYVAERDGQIVGYGAWAFDTHAFHSQFTRVFGVRAAFAILPHLIRPSSWRPLLRGLSYGSAHPDDPPAEMLSFATRANLRGGGVGGKLFQELLAEFKRRGVRRLKAGTVTPENEIANKWYRSLGFELVRTDPFYSDTRVNVYILTIQP